MIKIIIFDLGGVVFKEGWQGLNKDMVKKYGVSTLIRSGYNKEINKEYDKTTIGKSSMKNVFKKICSQKGLKLNIDAVCKFYNESYKKHKILNKDLIKIIKRLKKDYIVVCFTGTNAIHFKSHEEQGILNIFHESFASHLVKGSKEEKRSFIIVLKKLRVKPEETLFIDDNKNNVKTAKSIGIKTILFKNNQQFAKDLKKLK